jgi:hypothetical protein
MGRRPRDSFCKIRDHKWERLKGGKRWSCIVCDDIFPCYHDCAHIDCRAVRGDSIPGVGNESEARTAILSELNLIEGEG